VIEQEEGVMNETTGGIEDGDGSGIVKKFMFVNRKAPYGTIYALEGLEVVLISAAFDQDVSMAFLDDGVYQLAKGQHTKAIDVKNFSPTYRALEGYDIEKLYVERESLEIRGLNAGDLLDAGGSAVLCRNGRPDENSGRGYWFLRGKRMLHIVNKSPFEEHHACQLPAHCVQGRRWRAAVDRRWGLCGNKKQCCRECRPQRHGRHSGVCVMA